jgi:hypothetical protein
VYVIKRFQQPNLRVYTFYHEAESVLLRVLSIASVWLYLRAGGNRNRHNLNRLTQAIAIEDRISATRYAKTINVT